MIGNITYREAIVSYAVRRAHREFTLGDAIFVASNIPYKPIPKEHTVRSILSSLVSGGILHRTSRGRYAYAPLSWSF